MQYTRLRGAIRCNQHANDEQQHTPTMDMLNMKQGSWTGMRIAIYFGYHHIIFSCAPCIAQ